MKIISTLTFEASKATKAERDQEVSSRPNPKTARSGSGDSVRVSQIAIDLARGVQEAPLEEEEGTDPARLEQLRQEIEDGTYEVDPLELAAAILEEEL